LDIEALASLFLQLCFAFDVLNTFIRKNSRTDRRTDTFIPIHTLEKHA